MAKDNLERMVNERKKELIRLQSINIQVIKADSWNDPVYFKDKLSNVNTEMVLPKIIRNIDFNIMINKNGRLILSPGSELTFHEKNGILCQGQLIAKGEETENIIFKGNPTWGNIYVKGSLNESSLAYCIIQNGTGDSWYRSLNDAKNDQISGGGILVKRAEVNLENCKLTDNNAHYGGGIASYQSVICVREVEIRGNNAVWKVNGYGKGYGGGIFLQSSSGTMKEVLLYGNNADYGGGAYIDNSLISFNNNIIQLNNANYNGGGIGLIKSSIQGDKNIIKNNNCGNDGGGMFMYLSDSDGKMNKIISNRSSRGAGIYRSSSKVRGTHQISENYAIIAGGGMYIEGKDNMAEKPGGEYNLYDNFPDNMCKYSNDETRIKEISSNSNLSISEIKDILNRR